LFPEGAPVVFKVALAPLPETLPPVAVQLETVTGTLSGLVQVQVSATGFQPELKMDSPSKTWSADSSPALSP
jgi:hypothetical protein